MSREIHKVPFGYEPPVDSRRGTLVYYDTFEHTTDEELAAAAERAETGGFARFVLYPLHEATAKRMSKDAVSPFYKRADRLHDWKRESGGLNAVVEGWEGKRKKYTPIDSALRHLTETYPSPLFLYMTPETANLFAAFASFEEWIVRIRLILASEPDHLHPRLEQYRHRWSAGDLQE